MGPLRDHLSNRGLEFVAAGNVIMYHSMYGETTNNHKDADTLLRHCIISLKLDRKYVCVYASDVNVAVLLITHRNLLSCRNVYFGVSAEKTNTDFLSFLVVNAQYVF